MLSKLKLATRKIACFSQYGTQSKHKEQLLLNIQIIKIIIRSNKSKKESLTITYACFSTF